MVALSQWHILYSTVKFQMKEKVKDLYYEVTMKEGFRYSFEPTKEGLYIYIVSRDTDGYLFRKEILDNIT